MKFFSPFICLLFLLLSQASNSQPGPVGGSGIGYLALDHGQIIMSNDTNLIIYSLPSNFEDKQTDIDFFRLTFDNRSYLTDAKHLQIGLNEYNNLLFIQYKGQQMCAQLDIPGVTPHNYDFGNIDTLYFRPGNWIIHQYNRRGMTPEHLAECRARTKETRTESYWLYEPDHHTRLSFPTIERMSQNARIESAIHLLGYTDNTNQVIELGKAIWTDAKSDLQRAYAANILWVVYARKNENEKAYQWYLEFYNNWKDKFTQQGIIDFLIKIEHPEEVERYFSDMIAQSENTYTYQQRGRFYANVQKNYFAAVLDFQKALEREKEKEPVILSPISSNENTYLHNELGIALINANLGIAGLAEIVKGISPACYYLTYEEMLSFLFSIESTHSAYSDLYLAMALCEYRLAVLYPNEQKSLDHLFFDADLHFTMAEERGGNANLIAFYRADYYRILSQKERALAYLKLAQLDPSLKKSCEALLPYIEQLR